jgi:predicted amidohydrolase YtcJ
MVREAKIMVLTKMIHLNLIYPEIRSIFEVQLKTKPMRITTIYQILILMIILTGTQISCSYKQKKADLIVTNATIWTGNDTQPRAESMAIAGDTLMDVGSEKEILQYKGENTKVIDLEGHFVTPGFIDSHLHFLTGGFNLASVQLRDARTKEEFIRRIREYAKTLKPGDWMLGGDWDHTLWGGELPDRNWIDAVTPDNPVFINRLDGHMSLANSLALKLAGIDEKVKNVEGGAIWRDATGRLTGIFKENAAALIEGKIPPYSPAQVDSALVHAMHYVASKGVTSVHHMVGYIDAIERAHDNHTLNTRMYVMMPLSRWSDLKEKVAKEGWGDKWLKIGGLKEFIDGSWGSHTALLLEPFSDSPKDTGIQVNSMDDLYQWTLSADKEGFQVMIHAIGDRANRFILDMYDSVAKVNGIRDRRFRIEHAQQISPDDISRFGKSGVIPSMQPYHLIDDGRWAEKLIGPERIKTAYAFKTLLETGASLAFGSDWYVAPPTPLEGIYAAVTRRTLDDKNPEGWVPEQKITVDQALAAYTKNGAYASFEEKIKGTLEQGKLADFTVISDDLTEIDPVTIRDAQILQTWVGGKKVFDAEK